ncbi:MAG TPA: MarR family transcriptional regulator [Solirubrobacteraceae bacterium]
MATTSPSAVPELASRLRFAVTRTARRLRQEAAPAGLSPTLTAALATVDRLGPLTPSELAAAERIQRPTATRILARLEADGLLERAADPADRRSWLVSATPTGRALLHEVRTRKEAFLAERLAALEAADLAALERAATVLERLLAEDGR